MTLYEITGDYLRLLDMLQSDENLDEQAIKDTLDGIEGELEAKAEAYAKIIREIETEADKFAKEAGRLAERSATLYSRSELLKKRLFNSMKATGKEKFKTQLFSFGIQRNGGKRPLRIEEGADIPEEFCEIVPSYARIRAALESGRELPFAYLGEAGEHLRIR